MHISVAGICGITKKAQYIVCYKFIKHNILRFYATANTLKSHAVKGVSVQVRSVAPIKKHYIL